MARSWHSKLTSELIRTWDQKLKESGFEDAEEEGRNARFLKEGSRDRLCKKGPKNIFVTELVVSTSSTYYQMLSDNLHTEQNFADDFDRQIMEMTAEGKSIKEISIALKALVPTGKKRGKFNRDTIRYVRRRYEQKWGIREWSKEQMTSRKPPIK